MEVNRGSIVGTSCEGTAEPASPGLANAAVSVLPGADTDPEAA